MEDHAILESHPIRSWGFAAAILIITLLIPTGIASAQTQGTDAMRPASLQHSVLKGLTYKAGTITANMLFLRPATGSWVDAAILTSAFTGAAIGLYVANDYLWDKFYPAKVISNKESFDISESAKRTSLKFITYKTTVTAVTSGMLYLWTRSLPIVLTVGVGLALAKAGVFAVNDFAWDWYDWHTANAVSP